MEAVDALGLLTPVSGYGKAVVDGDPLDHEDVVLGLYLADSLDLELFALDLDLTRLQRAGESAGQSAASRGDDVVERRRMGWELLSRDAVMRGNFGMDSENHRLLLGRKVRQALGAAEPLDTHARDVAHFTHRRNATSLSSPPLVRGP